MTNSNHPARQQGDLIRRRFYYKDYRQVQHVIAQLEQQGAFEHQSERRTDERGTYVVIAYRDPMVVPADQVGTDVVRAPAANRQMQRVHRPVAAATRPAYRRWWFVPGVAVGVLAALCGFGYWVVQQLAAVSVPNLGVGIVGFLFVAVLVVWIVRNVGGGGGGSSSGRHGFHYTPCD